MTISKIEVIENKSAVPEPLTADETKQEPAPIKAEETKSAADKNSFIVTPDYIQQSMLFRFVCIPIASQLMRSFQQIAIKNALKQENLNPEIEEKLLNLQRFQEKKMKTDHPPTPTTLAHNHHEYTSPMKSTSARKRPLSRTLDGDWIVETPKRRPPKANSSSEKKSNQATVDASIDVNRIIQSVEEETAVNEGRTMPSTNVATETTISTTPAKSAKPSPSKSSDKPVSNRQLAAIKRESKKKAEQKRQVGDCWTLVLHFSFCPSWVLELATRVRERKTNSKLFI